MQASVICLLCMASSAVAGSATAWPGAVPLAVVPTSPRVLAAPVAPRLVAPVAVQTPVLKTIQPATTKSFGYSTSQYLNSYPFPYEISALRPGVNLAYQFPSYSSFAPAAVYPTYTGGYPTYFNEYPSYYPASSFVPSSTFIRPPGSFILPGVEAPAESPAPPSYPIGPVSQPGYPGGPSPQPGYPIAPSPQPAGDSDSTVIESADQSPSFPDQATSSQPANVPASFGEQIPSQQQNPQQPEAANTFPSFPPQAQQDSPSFPSFPQLPQIQFPEGSLPSFPQIPGFPQFPQFPQSPGSPQTPQAPQTPSTTPSPSFPATDGGDKGLNDEDTISVESAK